MVFTPRSKERVSTYISRNSANLDAWVAVVEAKSSWAGSVAFHQAYILVGNESSGKGLIEQVMDSVCFDQGGNYLNVTFLRNIAE